MEEMERLRAEFLAMVSHELRTPLSTVRGSVSALLDEPYSMHPVETRQFYRIILDQTDRMRALIADLLDVARIETRHPHCVPRAYGSGHDRGRGSKQLVQQRGHAQRARGANGEPALGDGGPIAHGAGAEQRALQRGPTLAPVLLHLGEGRAEGVHVAVSVTDEGRGIPTEDLPLLFRKFTRIEVGEYPGGTGLGLAICKGIVEAHGGRIRVESGGVGLGTRVTFTLPMVEDAGYVSPSLPIRVSSGLRGQRKEGQQVRILAVDDDPQALRYIRDALVKAGYAVIATGDGRDLHRLVTEEKPHLVLLDLMLPGVDGIELMREIDGLGGNVPVIFVSAYGQDQLVARAFEAGAVDYVVKPFSPTELAARIRAALRSRQTSEPTTPYVLGNLNIDYVQRRVSIAGSPVRLTPIQYRTLVDLSTNAGRVVTYEHLLQRVWGTDGDADMRPMRTVINALRRQLGDDAYNPTYIFTEPRIGYRMPRAETP